MQIKTMSLSSPTSYVTSLHNPNLKISSRTSVLFKNPSISLSFGTSRNHYYYKKRVVTSCVGTSGKEVIMNDDPETNYDDDGLVSGSKQINVVVTSKREELTSQSIWKQMKEVMMFSGPATGLWICSPLMSLISTAVIGQNKNEVQHQISVLLFVGLTCGILMLLFTQFLGSWALTAFAGPKNPHLVPVASKYVQIRGLAWPAVLYGLVFQSSSLGMKDSMAPLKALVVATASIVNVLGSFSPMQFSRLWYFRSSL